MKNFKKVVALTLALVMVLSTMTTAFAATNDAKADTLNKLGLFNGTSTTEYVADLDKEADAPTALVLIGRALGWEVDMTATTTFTDVPVWAAPYVSYAVEAGITNGVSDTEFGSDIITGQRVVAWLLRALGYDNLEAWENTEELAATAGITIPTGTLRDDVVGVIYQALMLTPMNGDSSLIEAIVLGDSAKTAIAVEAGLIPDVVAIVSATAIGTKTVEVKLNKAVDTETTTVVIKKGAATYSKSVAWNDAMTTATVTSVIDLPDATYTVYVTTADAELTTTFDVVDESEASVMFTTSVLSDETAESKVEFVVYNQYGEDMGIDSDDAAISIVAYNVTQGQTVGVDPVSGEQYFYVDTTDPDEDEFVEGDVVRFTMTYEGITAQANLTVVDAAAVSQIVFGDIILADEDDTILSVGDDDPQLVYYMVDQYGDEVVLDEAADKAAIETANDVVFLTSNSDVVEEFYVDEDGLLFLELADADSAADGTAIITAVVNESGSVGTKTVVVVEDSYPAEVEIAAPTDIIAAGDADSFDLALVITDQYGELLTSDDSIAFTIDNTDATVTPSDTDDVTILTVDVSNVDLAADDELVITATVNNSELSTDGDEIGTLTFDIQENAVIDDFDSATFATLFTSTASITIDSDDLVVYDQFDREYTDYTIALEVTEGTNFEVAAQTITALDAVDTSEIKITLTDTNDASTKTLSVDVEVIAASDVDTYSLVAIGDVYEMPDSVDSDYAIDIEIEGVDASGDTVNLVDSNPDVATTSDSSVGSLVEAAGVYTLTGEDAGTTTVSVWVDAVKVDSEVVTVSDVAPYAVSVAFDSDDSEVDVTDQYGVVRHAAYKTSGSTALTFADSTITVYFTDGGDTVITSNGLTATK